MSRVNSGEWTGAVRAATISNLAARLSLKPNVS